MRGRAMAFNQAVMFAATPVAAILSYRLVPIAPYGIDGWRWVVLIGCVGAVAVWFIRRAVPESPRWLAQQGRIDEADQVVRAIEGKVQRNTAGRCRRRCHRWSREDRRLRASATSGNRRTVRGC